MNYYGSVIFLNDPWVLRSNQIYTLLQIWKTLKVPIDRNIIKLIAKSVKIDLSKRFKLSNGGYAIFKWCEQMNPNSCFYGWIIYADCLSYYINASIETLRPNFNEWRHIKSLENYKNRFDF
jgi:hypothetical protein